ncbi:HAD family hydrolase [Eubacterium barkeri]|uniref:Phosphoglycolate phosphatase n=1 Tax=Eubacterium barkeri TaxID=1528 RepID=A0A1H3H231_EUBBA|nr:HAD-IA family hydrolase [Eubacterium barkeri]SDY09380.1 phosphoglycolate phosphatase [Eubacterium barkeri]
MAEELYTPKYDGIIFDLDGTLIDSLEDLIDACNSMLGHYGLPPKSYEEGKGLIGRGIRNLVKRALPEEMGRDESLLDEAEAFMKADYATRYIRKTRPYDGIKELIRYLHVKRIPFGICTNKPIEAAREIVDGLFDIKEFVDVIGQQVGQPRKPDPTQTLALAEKMGVAPERCIYMGDSKVDYETAKNAGMLPVLCTWGFTAPRELEVFKDAIWIKKPHRAIDAFKYGFDMYSIFGECKDDELKG